MVVDAKNCELRESMRMMFTSTMRLSRSIMRTIHSRR